MSGDTYYVFFVTSFVGTISYLLLRIMSLFQIVILWYPN